jgi:hypothetical protein
VTVRSTVAAVPVVVVVVVVVVLDVPDVPMIGAAEAVPTRVPATARAAPVVATDATRWRTVFALGFHIRVSPF